MKRRKGLEEEVLLIIQPFRRFIYVTAHYPTLLSLHLRHRSFSSLANPSVASYTSQVIIQALRRFTYVTTCSPTLLSLHLRHMHFTYVTWRAAHEPDLTPEPNSTYATVGNSVRKLFQRRKTLSKHRFF